MHPQKLTGTDDWAVKTSRESIWWKWLWTVLLSQEKKKKTQDWLSAGGQVQEVVE